MTGEEIDERDGLEFRSLMGETLTGDEQARLDALSAALYAELPQPEPLPAEVLAAIDAAHRLLGDVR